MPVASGAGKGQEQILRGSLQKDPALALSPARLISDFDLQVRLDGLLQSQRRQETEMAGP